MLRGIVAPFRLSGAEFVFFRTISLARLELQVGGLLGEQSRLFPDS
jgi:hypothetical protein